VRQFVFIFSRKGGFPYVQWCSNLFKMRNPREFLRFEPGAVTPSFYGPRGSGPGHPSSGHLRHLLPGSLQPMHGREYSRLSLLSRFFLNVGGMPLYATALVAIEEASSLAAGSIKLVRPLRDAFSGLLRGSPGFRTEISVETGTRNLEGSLTKRWFGGRGPWVPGPTPNQFEKIILFPISFSHGGIDDYPVQMDPGP
jgi:hypothetical protein